jgi:intein/homing endonuclease
MSEVASQVEQLKEVTHNIPALARQDPRAFQKAWRVMSRERAARAPKSAFFDPLSLQYALGYKDRRYSLTYDTLRRISNQLSVVAAIINTRIAQIASFSQPYRITKSLGYVIRHKDPEHPTTASEKRFIKQLEDFVASCGEPGRQNPFTRVRRPNFEQFLKMIVRDTLTYDQTSFEIIPRKNSLPFEFRAVDGSTIRLASPDKDVGELKSLHQRNPIHENAQVHPTRFTGMYVGQRYGSLATPPSHVQYVQIVNGQIENVYTDEELAFGVRNPRTDIYIQGYGFGEMEQLITILTSMLYAETYNQKFFTQGAHPKGILNFKGDNWTPDQLECVAEDSLVQTDRGTFSIGDAFNIQNSKDVQFKFWNGYSYELGMVSQSGVKPLVDIKFDNGTSLRATENHRVFVLTDEGEEERFVADLQPGDLLMQPESVVGDERFALKDLVNTKWEGSRQGEGVDFRIDEIGEDLWEFIGWQVGDGWLSKDLKTLLMFYHGTKDVDVFVEHGKILAKYGVSYKEKDQKENMRTWQICHKAFAEFLVEIGIGAGRDKKIPWIVYTQSPEKRAAFLRGLFSADGYVTSNWYSVAITSIYPALLDGIQQLLNTLGLSSYRVKHSKPNATQIYLRRRELYKEVVGFCQQYKMDLIAEVKDSARTPSDPVPLPLLRNLLEDHRGYFEDNDGHDKELKKAGLSIINKQKAARIKSRLYWKSFLARRGDSVSAELLGYRPIRVISIEPSTTEMTYDVTIISKAEPKFVVNGVVTHNSFKRQWVAQVAGADNSWKTPITQSEGIEWVNMQMTNQDMQFNVWLEYLIKVCSAVFLIDPAEINFDLHGGVQQTPLFESSQEWKLKASRDRGLKPLLRFIANLINVHVIDRIDDHFCCVPGTGVAQPDGTYKPIEEIQVGDIVWTHKNKHGVVTDLGSRDVDEDICRVVPGKIGLKSFEVTGDHPIWVLEMSKKYPNTKMKDPDSTLTRRINSGDGEGLALKFVKAGQLEAGKHWLALTQPELPCRDTKIDLLDYVTEADLTKSNSREFSDLGVWYKNRGYSYDAVAREIGCSTQTVSRVVKSRYCETEIQRRILARVVQLEQELQAIPKLQRFLNVDEKLAWVLGWFAAEGSFNKSGFIFSLCADTDPIEDLRSFFDKLGVPTSLHEHKGREHVVDLIVYNKALRKVFEECGSGAANKKIPSVILGSKKSVKLAFIEGLCGGDGTLSGVNRSFWTIHVSSEKLLTQLQFLLASMGILTSVRYLPPKKTWYKKEKRYIKTKDSYIININKDCLDNLSDPSVTTKTKYRCWGGYFIVPISEVQKFHYKGPVYNFSVDGDESYVIDSLAVVHNCFEFAGLDELTEQEKHEMLKEQISTYMTLNEGRRSLDMPDLGEIGDLPMNPTLIQALQFLDQRKQAEQQQQMEQEQLAAQAEQGQEAPEEAPDAAMKQEAHQQRMQQQAERHPLEMELLKQKINQTGAEPAAEGSEESPQDSRRTYSDLVGKAVDFDHYIETMRSQEDDDGG